MPDGTIVVRKFLLPATVGAGAIAVGLWLTTSLAQTGQTTARNGVAAATTCRENDAGITLPPGFCATMFADKLGHPRHMVVASDGVVYVNTWSGRYYQNDTPPPGGFLIALKDSKGDGHADIVQRFGATRAEGSHGGTGIALYKGWLYAEVNDRVIRYTLKPDEIAPTGAPETILSGMPLTGDHPMHPFSIDAAGNMYIDMGSATNACQSENRIPHSAGIQPCTELQTRAGASRTAGNGLRRGPAAGRYSSQCRQRSCGPSAATGRDSRAARARRADLSGAG